VTVPVVAIAGCIGYRNVFFYCDTYGVQVAKNRFDGELGIMLLKFDKDTLSFAVKSASKDVRSNSS